MTDATPMVDLFGAPPPPGPGVRREADFYQTPDNVWQPFAPVLDYRLGAVDPVLLVEPACGDGRLLSHFGELGYDSDLVLGLDIRPEAVEQTRERGFTAHRADWLAPDAADHLPNGGRGCAFVTNPPFNIAADFALACIERAGSTGLVALLLRLTFLEPTKARGDFLAACPADIWLPPKRGKFANGKTDTATCGWWVWPPEQPRAQGHLVRYLGRHKPGGAR